MTEAELLVLIRNRFPDPAYAVLPHVAEATGGYSSRTADAIVMSVWPSRGLELMGMECKVSRADWLRELKNPAKAEGIAKYMDRWWLVVSDRKIVGLGELPPTWGLLVAHGMTLRVDVEAPKLEPKPLNRSFLAAVLRNAARNLSTPDGALDELLRRAREEGRAEARHEARETDRYRREQDAEVLSAVARFEAASGIDIHSRPWQAGQIGSAVRWLTSHDGAPGIRVTLTGVRHAAERLAEIAAAVEADLPPEFGRG